MSTLRVGTISNAAGSQSTSAENVINGSAKAWVNFNGTGTVAIRASYNVTSITDNGVGDYTVNFTTALADANYSVSGSGTSPGTANAALVAPLATAPTASAVRVGTYGFSAFVDASYVSVAAHR